MPMKIEGDKIFYDCFLCQRPFQFGPHVYDGRHIPSWGVNICASCLKGNWDGIVPQRHPRLMQHLKDQGVTVTLNAKGWLPIP